MKTNDSIFAPVQTENQLTLPGESSDSLNYGKGQVIYMEGNTPMGAYWVRSGKVKISRIGSDGKEQITRIAVPGDMLSYAELLFGTRYTSSAKVLEDCTVSFLPKKEFLQTIRMQDKVFEQFLKLISMDLLDTEVKMTDLAYKPVRGRLADALITLVRKFRTSLDPDTLTISITRNDLACFVGTAKETVNRLISEFRNEGLIETEGIRIRIMNPDELVNIGRFYN